MTDTIKPNGNGEQARRVDYERELRALREVAAASVVQHLETPQGPMNPGTATLAAQAEHLSSGHPHQTPIISEGLVERAPAEMPAIVRSMHHTAAQALDDAATHLEQEMQSHIALMREAAGELRIQGDSQALTIEALSTLIRDTHGAFRQQADKLARFRSGQIGGA